MVRRCGKCLFFLCLCLALCVTAACADWEEESGSRWHDPEDAWNGSDDRDEYAILRELINGNGNPDCVDAERNEALLAELRDRNPEKAELWRDIIAYFNRANSKGFVNLNALPGNLPQDNSLCLVVLGYELNADGSMKPELEKRLQVARENLEKYPRAMVLVAGGGTAYSNKEVTEADVMTQWLKDNGIDEARIIVENRSLNTLANARNSLRILTKSYPQIRNLAIITSDYHVPWGSVTYYAEIVLSGGRFSILSNAACQVDSATYTRGAVLAIQREQLWALAQQY